MAVFFITKNKGDTTMAIVTPAAQTRTDKQERELRIMYIRTWLTRPTGADTSAWYRLGFDNDDLAREIAWNEDSTKNVWGITVTSNTRGDETISLDPQFMREGDPMSLLIQHLDFSKAELDAIKRPYAEVKLDRQGNVIGAFIQECDVMVQSAGGSSEDADNMPVNLILSGERIECDYDLATETFTPKA